MITSWTEAWAHLRTLDGAAWDDEAERLEREWRESYRAEFARFAAGRPGWLDDDAADWAHSTVDEALDAYRGCDTSPEEAAQTDVLACELEAG